MWSQVGDCCEFCSSGSVYGDLLHRLRMGIFNLSCIHRDCLNYVSFHHSPNSRRHKMLHHLLPVRNYRSDGWSYRSTLWSSYHCSWSPDSIAVGFLHCRNSRSGDTVSVALGCSVPPCEATWGWANDDPQRITRTYWPRTLRWCSVSSRCSAWGSQGCSRWRVSGHQWRWGLSSTLRRRPSNLVLQRLTTRVDSGTPSRGWGGV